MSQEYAIIMQFIGYLIILKKRKPKSAPAMVNYFDAKVFAELYSG